MSYLFEIAKYIRTAEENVQHGQKSSTARNDALTSTTEDLVPKQTLGGAISARGDTHQAGRPAQTRDALNKVSRDHVLVSQIRSISNKAKVRIDLEMKHQMCKRCNAVLLPGSTSTEGKENRSKDSKKPWATARVIHCTICGTSKRFPMGAKRQSRKTQRPRSEG